MSNAPAAKVDMRELLDGYRAAVEKAEAVELANMLSADPEACTFGTGSAFICQIWDQAGKDPAVHRRAAKRFKDQLVVANRGLIRIVAKSVLGVASKNAENLAEAEQEGAMGVMRAVDAFDPERGLWSICARHWIRYYVQTCAHRQTDFPRQRHQRMPPEVAKQANIIRARLGREPLHAELTCKGVAVTPEQWRAWTERAQVGSFQSHTSYHDREANELNVEDCFADERESPDLVLANADFGDRLKKAIDKMSPRNRAILSALFVEGASSEEVEERFHIQKRRIQQIKLILTDRLREVLAS